MTKVNIQEIAETFSQFASALKSKKAPSTNEYIQRAIAENAWFTTESIDHAINGLNKMLQKKKIEKWLANYKLNPQDKTIGIIAAGNIPMVAFHDILCVLISGNKALVKLSSKDKWLYELIKETLFSITNKFNEKLVYTEGKLEGIEGIIATGSDNSARYFEHYFGKYPNIIRKNRNSIAILSGEETETDLQNLAHDIFLYFGLGCRNISQIFLPKDYDITKLIDAFEEYNLVAQHNKYFNNYEYQKTILLLNQIPFYDNGFAILKEDSELASPIGVVHFTKYEHINYINDFQKVNKHKIQCAVSKTKLDFLTYGFGKAQEPELWDYADNIDTMQFLINL